MYSVARPRPAWELLRRQVVHSFKLHRLKVISNGARMTTDNHRRRFDILGIGPTSLFMASCLRLLPDPPSVTLLVWSNRQLEWFAECEGKIKFIEGDREVEITGVGMEVVKRMGGSTSHPLKPAARELQLTTLRLEPSLNREHRVKIVESSDNGTFSPISNLIITSRAEQRLTDMLSWLRPRLTAHSTILRSNNSFYEWRDLCHSVFQNPSTRPSWVQSVSA